MDSPVVWSSQTIVANSSSGQGHQLPFNISNPPMSNAHTGDIIAKIEDILESVITDLLVSRPLIIPLRSRQTGQETPVSFPANTEAGVKRFKLFGTQRYVDRLVDDIAFTFGHGRDALNIVAGSKGLVAGHIVVTLRSGNSLDCARNDDGTLIPYINTIGHVDIEIPAYEDVYSLNQATFRSLAASRYYGTSSAGPGVLITLPAIPLYAVIDFDPHGIDIIRTYQRGSRSLAHEENVLLPELRWIGPRSEDILSRIVDSHLASSSQVEVVPSPTPGHGGGSGINPYSAQHTDFIDIIGGLRDDDRSLAIRLLNELSEGQHLDVHEQDLRREVQVMLMLNVKAEIQAVDHAGDLAGWLDTTLI
ncbi:DNA topoisomerase IV, alpha subunit [Xylariaceae sp. FL0016]|nr:DNA topoisomerase IV, alpha subunit [Xylariaceae sp. FL0016]